MSRVLITGSTEGLGLMAAGLLAGDGHSVTLHARSAARAEDARAALPAARAVVVGDLSSIAGMRQVAGQANAAGPYDAVIHNAGVGYREPRRIRTDDGLEHIFAIKSRPRCRIPRVACHSRVALAAGGLLLPPGTVHPSAATGGVSMAWPIFGGLFDDASLFPPASLPMADAVAGYLRHQAAWYQEMSGPFVCADTKITELSAAVTAAGVVGLDLALVLPGGAAGLDAGVDSVFADPRLRLRAVEVPAAARESITTAVADVAAALDRTPLAGAAGFIEVPARDFTTAAARVVDEHRYRAKIRTGGATAQAFPDDQTLANCLVTLAQTRLAFKCTAGLHHAVRHRAADTGFEHHGFLNVLLAVAAALDDATWEQVAAELADRDAARVAAKISNLDAETVSAVRTLFTSFGTCSTDEPINDLVTLGLADKD